ncbi:hypothetical protein Tco_1112014 [Tanacetum coccineum]|uniref:Reverse transcriptase domain-containing protein n=1 Tax=Tanacetum coccineum TaxID=301880 RepID=A0ABQ5IN91_9ASTR
MISWQVTFLKDIDSFKSVKLNWTLGGSPTKEFKSERGLHQGDPLSPFLFLIVAKALPISILEACGKASGLKVNISKSRLIGVGVSISEVNSLAILIGCTSDSILFIYLGLPVDKRMWFVDGWDGVVNRLRERLSSWKAKNLSIGGRLTLVKYILGSIPIYYLSLFKAPMLVINTLESLHRRFFWGFKDSHRGISEVKWDSILVDVKNGGLGVRSILAKPPWKMEVEAVALISGRTNGTCLLELFPRLYALESFKDCKVNERRGLFNGVWGGTRSWRIPPRGRSVDDVSALISHIGNLHLCPLGSDKWAWVGDLSGSFKVKSLSNKIENILLNGSLLGEHGTCWIP